MRRLMKCVQAAHDGGAHGRAREGAARPQATELGCGAEPPT